MFIYYVFAVDSFTNKYAYALKQWSEFYLLRFAKTHSHSFTHSSSNNVNVFNLSATGTVKHCQASVLRAEEASGFALHSRAKTKWKIGQRKTMNRKGKVAFSPQRSAHMHRRICSYVHFEWHILCSLSELYACKTISTGMAKTFHSRLLYGLFCCSLLSLSDSYTFVRIRWIPVMCVQMDEVSFEVKKKKMTSCSEKEKREKPEQQISFDVHTECVGMKNGIHRAKRTDSLLKIGSGKNAHNYTVVMAKTLQIHQ